MNISDKAVEAAARAIANATDHHRGFIGTIDAARIALEAAGPFIAAQALRDAAEDCNCGDDADLLDCKAEAMEEA